MMEEKVMAHLVESNEGLREILQNVKTIALVGASDKVERPSHRVMKFLQGKGYRVIPVNPRLEGKELLGEIVYGTLIEIPEKIDMVDVFRRPEAALTIVQDAIEINADVVWMQLGVINNEAAEKASTAGLKAVMDHCPAIEIPRLGL